MQQLRRFRVSRVCGEKVAATRTEKLGTHTHTHTHAHTHTHTHMHTHTHTLTDNCYTLAANAYTRVMITKVQCLALAHA